MSQNPTETEASGDLSNEVLHMIASRQRIIINCIVIYIAAGIFQFAVPTELRPFFGLGVFAVIIVATVFVFLLATKLYGTGIGLLLGILTLIPLIGLISLLVVNGKATGALKQHGIKVGLLGSKM